MAYSRSNGFTLIELVITLAVLAIVVTWAIPSFLTLIQQNRLTATTNQMLGVVSQARGEALRRSDRIWVSPLDGSSWSSGVAIWRDENNDGTRAESEIIRLTQGPGSPVSISGSSTTLAIVPFGFDGGGFAIDEQAYSLTFCSDSLSDGQILEINGGGQIRTQSVTCGGGG